MESSVVCAGIGLALSMFMLVSFGHRLRGRSAFASILLLGATCALALEIQAMLTAETLSLVPTVGITLLVGLIVIALFRSWNAVGHVVFTAVVLAAATFLFYVFSIIMTAELDVLSLSVSVLLLSLQTTTLLLFIAHSFEVIDVGCRVHWKEDRPVSVPGFSPKVSLHVPTHNEPPELVMKTLDALAKLDYSDYEVLVIDNNTADERTWRPVKDYCERLGPKFRFFHLMPWEGYKAGALNFALSRTAPEAEIIGVIDADYVVQSNYLSELVGFFANPKIAFVQTPQDYRDRAVRGRYGRALYLAYQYFFEVSMVSRNEHNAIIYAGTMGLIRRSALEEAGGWGEWCITEDAEVSLRLLDAGYKSVYVNKSYGYGLMPMDYADLKKQRFRWAFGGMQILRRYFGLLVNPWSGGKLTPAQRFAYLSGGLQWLNDPLTMAFTVILLAGGAALLLGNPLNVQPLAGVTMFLPLLFILFAMVKFVWVFRLRTGRSVIEVVDALVVMLGLTWVVALACVHGLTKERGVFLRTPKQRHERRTMRDVGRLVRGEFLVGSLSFLSAIALVQDPRFDFLSTHGFVAFLLLWQSFVFFSAVRTGVWSLLENRGLMTHAKRKRREYRSERKPALAMGLSSLLLIVLLYAVLRSGTLQEKILRSAPMRMIMNVASFVQQPGNAAVDEALAQEADAAVRSDLETALSLWHPDGIIIDANFTSENRMDDVVWRGIDEIRERYTREFEKRRYYALRHDNLRTEVKGDTAVVYDDLIATVRNNMRLESVRLANTDRWVLHRSGNGRWVIVELNLNRASLEEPLFPHYLDVVAAGIP